MSVHETLVSIFRILILIYLPTYCINDDVFYVQKPHKSLPWFIYEAIWFDWSLRGEISCHRFGTLHCSEAESWWMMNTKKSEHEQLVEGHNVAWEPQVSNVNPKIGLPNTRNQEGGCYFFFSPSCRRYECKLLYIIITY